MNSVERADRFLLGARAHILDDTKEMAWAERHVRHDPNIKWILGNFVEADNPNENGHIFPLEDLKLAQQTIPNKPLNMLHHGNYIVGAYVAAEMLWPETGEVVTEAVEGHPYIEALSAFWRHQFPEEYELVQKAHDSGGLFYSMEAIPETLTCPKDDCSAKEVAYVGRQSDTYCAHMNAPRGKKILNKPHFGAGALIVPPAKPGWKRADINELSSLLNTNADAAEAIYAHAQSEFPHLDPSGWETLMGLVMLQARDFGSAERQKLTKKGQALPDGSFPIVTVADLRNAISAWGRASADKKAAVKRHIIKRAKALGATNLLPDGWK